jgi:hypothetical protein
MCGERSRQTAFSRWRITSALSAWEWLWHKVGVTAIGFVTCVAGALRLLPRGSCPKQCWPPPALGGLREALPITGGVISAGVTTLAGNAGIGREVNVMPWTWLCHATRIPQWLAVAWLPRRIMCGMVPQRIRTACLAVAAWIKLAVVIRPCLVREWAAEISVRSTEVTSVNGNPRASSHEKQRSNGHPGQSTFHGH